MLGRVEEAPRPRGGPARNRTPGGAGSRPEPGGADPMDVRTIESFSNAADKVAAALEAKHGDPVARLTKAANLVGRLQERLREEHRRASSRDSWERTEVEVDLVEGGLVAGVDEGEPHRDRIEPLCPDPRAPVAAPPEAGYEPPTAVYIDRRELRHRQTGP
jgi:hypothetical protein